MSRKEKNGKKVGLIIIIIILFVGVGVGCYFLLGRVMNNEQNSEEKSKPEETSKVVRNVNDEKTSGEVKKIEDSEIEKEDGIEVIAEDDPNNSDFVTGEISYSGFKGDKYRITVVTEQALSEGECRLTLSGEGMLEAEAEIVARPNSSSCMFELDEIEDGEWKAEVLVTTTGGREGVIMGEVEVKR